MFIIISGCFPYAFSRLVLVLSAGGSLTVQIFGSTSPAKSYKEEKDSKKLDYPVVSDKHNRLSASPVTVSSRKDIPDMLNK